VAADPSRATFIDKEECSLARDTEVARRAQQLSGADLEMEIVTVR
jgi:hypothetical protein